MSSRSEDPPRRCPRNARQSFPARSPKPLTPAVPVSTVPVSTPWVAHSLALLSRSRTFSPPLPGGARGNHCGRQAVGAGQWGAPGAQALPAHDATPAPHHVPHAQRAGCLGDCACAVRPRPMQQLSRPCAMCCCSTWQWSWSASCSSRWHTQAAAPFLAGPLLALFVYACVRFSAALLLLAFAVAASGCSLPRVRCSRWGCWGQRPCRHDGGPLLRLLTSVRRVPIPCSSRSDLACVRRCGAQPRFWAFSLLPSVSSERWSMHAEERLVGPDGSQVGALPHISGAPPHQLVAAPPRPVVTHIATGALNPLNIQAVRSAGRDGMGRTGLHVGWCMWTARGRMPGSPSERGAPAASLPVLVGLLWLRWAGPGVSPFVPPSDAHTEPRLPPAQGQCLPLPRCTARRAGPGRG